VGVELAVARAEVESVVGRGSGTGLGTQGLTPRAKRAIELAVEEARRLNHNYVGTEHLLLGMLREGEGIAAAVLGKLGVDLSKAREETVRILKEQSRG
jgi:ATP-dependent Clp protease ATP-binding subunit ClpC